MFFRRPPGRPRLPYRHSICEPFRAAMLLASTVIIAQSWRIPGLGPCAALHRRRSLGVSRYGRRTRGIARANLSSLSGSYNLDLDNALHYDRPQLFHESERDPIIPTSTATQAAGFGLLFIEHPLTLQPNPTLAAAMRLA